MRRSAKSAQGIVLYNMLARHTLPYRLPVLLAHKIIVQKPSLTTQQREEIENERL